MKGVVIYKSKYGATTQYAQWISASLKLPIFETDELDDGDLNQYDFVILGSSVYIGKLLIKKWVKDNIKNICNKRIFLFVVCGTPLNQTEKLESYISVSIPAEVRNKCDIFFLPGKLKIKALSWIDSFMLKMGASLTKDKTTKKAMLTDYNGIKKGNLVELINSVKKNTAEISKTELQEPVA